MLLCSLLRPGEGVRQRVEGRNDMAIDHLNAHAKEREQILAKTIFRREDFGERERFTG